MLCLITLVIYKNRNVCIYIYIGFKYLAFIKVNPSAKEKKRFWKTFKKKP